MLTFILQWLEETRTDILRCRLTFPAASSSLHPSHWSAVALSIQQNSCPCLRVSWQDLQEKLSHVLRNWNLKSPQISVIFREGCIIPLCSHRISLRPSSSPSGKWIFSQKLQFLSPFFFFLSITFLYKSYKRGFFLCPLVSM